MSLEYRYKFHGRIQSGKFEFNKGEREHFGDVCKTQQDQDVELVLQNPEKDRSDRQRRYYYGVVMQKLCERSGYDKEDMNEIMAKMFLRFEIQMKDGSIGEFYRRPSSLNTKETEVFHGKVRDYAMAEYQLYIPLPNEVEGQYDFY